MSANLNGGEFGNEEMRFPLIPQNSAGRTKRAIRGNDNLLSRSQAPLGSAGLAKALL